MNHRTPRPRRIADIPRLESGFRFPGDELQLHTCARDALLTWSLPWEVRDVHTSLGNTMVLMAGAPSLLPTAVIIPGAALSAAMMEAAVTELARTRRVLVVDVPGEPGLSAARRPTSADLDHYGSWLDEVVAALDEESVVLIGHGFGAAIVLSSTPQQSIAWTVLVSPDRLTTIPWFSWTALRRFLWRRRTGIDAAQHYLEHITGPHFEPSPPLLSWFCNVAAYCRPTPSRPTLAVARISEWTRYAPMVVAVGTDDPIATPRAVARALHGYTVSMIELPDIGHMAPVEDPSCLARILHQQELPHRGPPPSTDREDPSAEKHQGRRKDSSSGVRTERLRIEDGRK